MGRIRKHPGIPFSLWTPAEDAAILPAQPMPNKGRRVRQGEPRPVSELVAVALKPGRSVSAVRTRQSRLLKSR